jgi:hypothetical protein
VTASSVIETTVGRALLLGRSCRSGLPLRVINKAVEQEGHLGD